MKLFLDDNVLLYKILLALKGESLQTQSQKARHQMTAMNDAEYVKLALRPEADRWLASAVSSQESKAKISAILDSCSVDQWTTAYRQVGLIGRQLVQELVRASRQTSGRP
jgi:hypothetical protein